MSTRKTKTTPTKPKAAPRKAVVKSTVAPATKTASSATPATNDAAMAAPELLGPILRKKELIEKVVARSGIKKKDAKPVVEAVLAELGVALADSREMALPPLGRVKINRSKPLPNGQVTIVKVRQKKPGLTKTLPAAE